MSQDRQATDIQQSYVERNGLNFTRSEMDWQFICIMDNGISGSVKKPEWNWCNADSLELLSGEKCINETVYGTGVHKCCNGNRRY